MELTLSFEQALDGLHKAVVARGADFIYPNEWRIGGGPTPNGHEGYCVNFGEDGKPRCIVGYVLWLNGVIPDNDDWFTAGVDRLSGRDGDYDAQLYIDDKTHILLFGAQQAQDVGKTWGSAVLLAEKAVEAYDRNQTGND